MAKYRAFPILSALLFVAYTGGASASLEVQNDERMSGEHHCSFSFVVGCNRVDAADVSPDNPSTANLEQLNRTFREISELSPLPKFLLQIIAGNGGSVLEAGVTGDDRYYGFTLVTVGRHGSVMAESFGRDVPAEGYRAPSDAYPTTIRDSVSLSR